MEIYLLIFGAAFCCFTARLKQTIYIFMCVAGIYIAVSA